MCNLKDTVTTYCTTFIRFMKYFCSANEHCFNKEILVASILKIKFIPLYDW